MADVPDTAGAAQRPRIQIDQPEQRRDWARKLDVTEEQLDAAVRAVGSDAADVEMHLKGSRSTTNAEQTKRAGA